MLVWSRHGDATGGYQAVYAVIACVPAASWAVALRLPAPAAKPNVQTSAAVSGSMAG